jgi:hypothetical protein
MGKVHMVNRAGLEDSYCLHTSTLGRAFTLSLIGFCVLSRHYYNLFPLRHISYLLASLPL